MSPSGQLRGGTAERFRAPPPVYGPTPIWWWSGEKLDSARLRWQLEQFAAGGIGALVVLNLAPSGPLEGCEADDPPFFSEEWWRIFERVCADADELGVKLYFYDQIGFSGANIQGEIVTRRPDFAGRALHRVAQVTSDAVALECPADGEPLMACATPVDEAGQCLGPPVRVPLDGRRLHWAGSDRPHRIMLAYEVRLGFDYFAPAACEELLHVVHGAYESRVGSYFGRVIVGSFQDELPSMPTWARHFAAEFQRRNGYDLLPQLASLWEDHGIESSRVRRDYHATRAALAEEAFFEPLYRWHADRDLICGFDQQDSSRAGFPVDTVVQYADYPRTHRWFGAPGSDHHGDAKIHSSLAHIYDRPRVWIEAFHSSGWGGTLEETFDWLLPWLRAGANLYNPHAVYYSTRGGWWEWAPPSTDWRQPYWRHHDRFAATVARLCSVLTLGRHICDVAVLHPTATVQAGATLDGPTGQATRAHDVYQELVGQMRWYDVSPGVLDRACRDFDVLDDAALNASTVRDGALLVGEEAYPAVVLPGCGIIDGASAERLAKLATAGGTVIAVDTIPAQLTALVESGHVHAVATAEEVAGVLAGLPARVRAPVPTLLRDTGDATVLFVPATSPRATRVDEGGETHRWTRISYAFDPGTYARTMTVTVRGVSGGPALWEPYSGRTRPLPWRERGSGRDGAVEVDVPFDDAPGVLVVWPHEPEPAHRVTADPVDTAGEPADEAATSAVTLDGPWRVRLTPTLDNRWGDFAYPPIGKLFPVQHWDFRWRREPRPGSVPDEDWSSPDIDDAGWEAVRATFGPHGLYRVDRGGEKGSSGSERPIRYSTSRGIAADEIHEPTLGPKGHVPEEFLDFGEVRAGESVHVRTSIDVAEPLACHLAAGAPARTEAWLEGVQVLTGDEPGYLAQAPVSLERGRNLLELKLTADRDTRLRSSFAFVTDPETYRRPEWMTIGHGSGRPGTTVSFVTEFDAAPGGPEWPGGFVYLGSGTPCRLLVNDAEVARQGGFAPYFASFQVDRIGVYDIGAALRPGRNVLRVEASDLGESVGVLVDGVVSDRPIVQSGAGWHAERDGVRVEPVLWSPRLFDPPRAHAWRRPHPLPAADWLEGDIDPAGTVLSVVAGVPESGDAEAEWLRFRVPPGAVRMRAPVCGTARAWVDGMEVPCRTAADGSVEADLPGAGRAGRVCAIRIEPRFGHSEGAVLAGPVTCEFGETGGGVIELGDWNDRGLAGFSGGVWYARSLRLDPEKATRVRLDLGRVRGTAEVRVNGVSAGVRIWSPYVFDLTEVLQAGDNELEILVLNTLGPYLEAAAPTHYVFPGQKESGLFGPVRLLSGPRPERHGEPVIHQQGRFP